MRYPKNLTHYYTRSTGISGVNREKQFVYIKTYTVKKDPKLKNCKFKFEQSWVSYWPYRTFKQNRWKKLCHNESRPFLFVQNPFYTVPQKKLAVPEDHSLQTNWSASFFCTHPENRFFCTPWAPVPTLISRVQKSIKLASVVYRRVGLPTPSLSFCQLPIYIYILSAKIKTARKKSATLQLNHPSSIQWGENVVRGSQSHSL